PERPARPGERRREQQHDEQRQAAPPERIPQPMHGLVRQARVVQREHEERGGADGRRTTHDWTPAAPDDLNDREAGGGEPDDVQEKRRDRRRAEQEPVVEIAVRAEQDLPGRLAVDERGQAEACERIEGVLTANREPATAPPGTLRYAQVAVPRQRRF